MADAPENLTAEIEGRVSFMKYDFTKVQPVKGAGVCCFPRYLSQLAGWLLYQDTPESDACIGTWNAFDHQRVLSERERVAACLRAETTAVWNNQPTN